jgi:hypothetical protein
MMQFTARTPTNLSATGQVRGQPGAMSGVLCNSSTAGTLTLRDGNSSGSLITNAVALVAGAYIPIPATYRAGLHATIGGTADITIFAD